MRLPRPTSLARTLALILGITIVDALVVHATLSIAAVQGIAPVWPPAGIALAVLVWGGRRLWPAVLAGSLAGNLLAGAPVVAALGAGVSGAVEAVVVATLLLRCGADARCARQRDALTLLRCGAIGAVPAALLGVTALRAGGLVDLPVWRAALMWGLGDVLGLLLLTPALLTLLEGGTGAPRRAGTAERLASYAVLAVGLAIAATSKDPATAYTAPAMLWIAARQGPAAARPAGPAGAPTPCGAPAPPHRPRAGGPPPAPRTPHA